MVAVFKVRRIILRVLTGNTNVMRKTLLLLCLAISVSPTQAEETRYCFDGIYALKENRLDDAIALYTRCIDEGELAGLNRFLVNG